MGCRVVGDQFRVVKISNLDITGDAQFPNDPHLGIADVFPIDRSDIEISLASPNDLPHGQGQSITFKEGISTEGGTIAASTFDDVLTARGKI